MTCCMVLLYLFSYIPVQPWQTTLNTPTYLCFRPGVSKAHSITNPAPLILQNSHSIWLRPRPKIHHFGKYSPPRQKKKKMDITVIGPQKTQKNKQNYVFFLIFHDLSLFSMLPLPLKCSTSFKQPFCKASEPGNATPGPPRKGLISCTCGTSRASEWRNKRRLFAHG